MTKNLRLTLACILYLAIISCGPNRQALEATYAAETSVAASPTPTVTPTFTPTYTPSPTFTPTYTPSPTYTLTPSPTPKAGDMQLSELDGMEMIYIPAGEFEMGCKASQCQGDDLPPHTVRLDAFWMDQTEVTNAMYATYTKATGYKTVAEDQYFGSGVVYVNNDWRSIKGANWKHPEGPDNNIDGKENDPVVQLSWEEASDYCSWAGERLPTEAEWEYAAGSNDGRLYPWGNMYPSGELANFADINFLSDYSDIQIDDGYRFTAPVGSYPSGITVLGLLDMAGNVAEWVSDIYDEKYYEVSPADNPVGPAAGEYGVARGGSFAETGYYLMTSARLTPRRADMFFDLGFRCVRAP